MTGHSLRHNERTLGWRMRLTRYGSQYEVDAFGWHGRGGATEDGTASGTGCVRQNIVVWYPCYEDEGIEQTSVNFEYDRK